jgi:hypothetical protein
VPLALQEETPGEKLSRLRDLLTYEQRVFCEEYCKSLDPPKAYTVAFGKSNTGQGYALLKRWYIKEYLAALTECDDPADALLTKEECLVTLRDIIRNPDVKPGTKIRAVEVAFKGLGIGDTLRHTGPDGKSPPTFVGLTKVHILQIRSGIMGIRAPIETSIVEKPSTVLDLMEGSEDED